MKVKVYRLKNRRKFFSFLFIMLVIIYSVGCVTSAGKDIKKEYRTVTVKPGDTLWDIASKYCGNMDIRKYIYQIKKINNLDDAVIYAGQKLCLP